MSCEDKNCTRIYHPNYPWGKISRSDCGYDCMCPLPDEAILENQSVILPCVARNDCSRFYCHIIAVLNGSTLEWRVIENECGGTKNCHCPDFDREPFYEGESLFIWCEGSS